MEKYTIKDILNSPIIGKPQIYFQFHSIHNHPFSEFADIDKARALILPPHHLYYFKRESATITIKGTTIKKMLYFPYLWDNLSELVNQEKYLDMYFIPDYNFLYNVCGMP